MAVSDGKVDLEFYVELLYALIEDTHIAILDGKPPSEESGRLISLYGTLSLIRDGIRRHQSEASDA